MNEPKRENRLRTLISGKDISGYKTGIIGLSGFDIKGLVATADSGLI